MCFNLPPSMRYKPQYTYLAGIVPAPNQPDMVTISNVLSPIVNEVISMLNGKNIITHLYPKG
jgi:hypothetical protein